MKSLVAFILYFGLPGSAAHADRMTGREASKRIDQAVSGMSYLSMRFGPLDTKCYLA